MNKKRIITFILLALLSIIAYYKDQNQQQPTELSNQAILAAYQNKQSDLQVTGSGIVIKLLPDDNKGSRHQKLIVKVDPNQTILIAHNIDLAPRADVKEGEIISFYGEYEWNAKGGVVHWTHHDPRGKHPDGWLKVNGRKYQ